MNDDSSMLLVSSDGSHTLFSTEFQEHYHSLKGAVEESDHVFIRSGLEVSFERFSEPELSIFEVGFGTGLNAFMTLLKMPSNKKVFYESIELHPLGASVVNLLNYAAVLNESDELFLKLHDVVWDEMVTIRDDFFLQKRQVKLQEFVFAKELYHLIYMDAFSPRKQPEMWAVPILEGFYHSLKPGGILVTYCAQGQFKRDLKAVGFDVETLPGPLGKKEMVRASKVTM